jgi:tripartite-type tricarboxylate transporter receptor subunit TctC
MCLALLHGVTAPAQGAEEYPSRPVSIIVPAQAGGGIDIVVRLVADGLRDRLGQPFVLDNRGGGGGSIGATAAARADGDGYTLFASPNSPLVFLPLTKSRLPYDPETFVPVIQLGSQPLVLAVRGDFPGSSFRDLIDYAKADPGKMNYSSVGVGSGNHLSALLLQQLTGTTMVHIPYSGEAPARQAVVAGTVDFFMAPMANMLPLHQQGVVKIFAVGSAARIPDMPDVPTFAELGYPDEMVLTVWYALMAPPKTPDGIVERLNAAVNDVFKDASVRARYRTLGIDPVGGTPQALKDFVASEMRRWKAVVETAQIPKE